MALIVNDTAPRAQYTASGGQTEFAYPFEIFEDADLLVYLTPVGNVADDDADILILATNYTVSNAGVTGGGDVTLLVAATAGDIITIQRDVAVKRTTDFQTAGDLLAATLNDELDKFVMMVQQQEDALAGRLMKFINTANLSGVNTALPPPGADEILKWDSAGTALVGVKLSDIDPTAITVTAFAETLLDDANGDDFWATLNAAFTSGIALDQILTISESLIVQKLLTQKVGTDLGDADITAGVLTLGDGNIFDINSSEAITSIATKGAGSVFFYQFDQAQLLTHHATDLILEGGANITTAAGDKAIGIEYVAGKQRIYFFKASGQPIANAPIVLGDLPDGSKLDLQTAQATTSGTEIDFTSIPSWVKRITLTFMGVSASGTDRIIVQLGDSGGFETTGYGGTTGGVSTSSAAASANSDGFKLHHSTSTGASIYEGEMVFTLADAATNTWVSRTNAALSSAVAAYGGAGSKSLSGALTQIRLTTQIGSDTFDAGKASVLYE